MTDEISIASRLHPMAEAATSLEFRVEVVAPDQLLIELSDGISLQILAPPDDEIIVGFLALPWHFHGTLCLEINEDEYLYVTVDDLLLLLRTGEALIVEQLVESQLEDRWIVHKNRPLELKYIEPEEVLLVRRLSDESSARD